MTVNASGKSAEFHRIPPDIRGIPKMPLSLRKKRKKVIRKRERLRSDLSADTDCLTTGGRACRTKRLPINWSALFGCGANSKSSETTGSNNQAARA
jgi:hypothetical protein